MPSEKRCPYCDDERRDEDEPLDEHVLTCQPWRVELRD